MSEEKPDKEKDPVQLRVDAGIALERMARDFPEPFADLAAQCAIAVASDDDADVLDWMARLNAVTVRFLGILGAIEYVRAVEGKTGVKLVPTETATTAIRSLQKGGAPGDRGWLLKFFAVLEPFKTQRDLLFCQVLADLATSGPFHKEMTNRIDVRNRLIAHAFVVADGSLAQERLRSTEYLIHLREHLKFLVEYRLARVIAVQKGDVKGDAPMLACIEDRTGCGWRRPHRHVWLQRSEDVRAAQGHIVLMQRMDGRGESKETALDWLDMHPFVLERRASPDASSDETSEILLFETQRSDSKVILSGVRTSERHEREVRPGWGERLAPDTPFKRHLLEKKIASSPTISRTVAEIRGAALDRTSSFLERMRAQQVYIREAYIDRPTVHKYLDDWRREPEPRLLLLTGMAGAGKTSLLCQRAELFTAGGTPDPVLLVPSSDIPTGRDKKDVWAIDEWLARQFGWPGDLKELRKAWKKEMASNKAHMLVLVDGIDRAADPAGCLAALAHLVDDPIEEDPTIDASNDLRVAATIAQPLLVGLHSQLRTINRLWKDLEGSAGGFALGIDHLTENELKSAYEAYAALPTSHPRTSFLELSAALKAAVRNPLLLRMTCHAYHGDTIPADATEANVIARYAERALDQDVRRYFVRRLVEKHIVGVDLERTPRRSVPMDTLLADPELRDLVLAPDGAYRALVESHVLSEVTIRDVQKFDLPRRHVEFAFDALLGYLIFAFGTPEEEPEARDAARAIHYATHAQKSAPMGYALDLLLRTTDPERLPRRARRVLHADLAASGVPAVARLLEWASAQHSHRHLTTAMLAVTTTEDTLADLLTKCRTWLDDLRHDEKSAQTGKNEAAVETNDISELLQEIAAFSRSEERRLGPGIAELVALAKELQGRGALLVAAGLARLVLDSQEWTSLLNKDSRGKDSRWTLEHILASACLRDGSEEALGFAAKRLKKLLGEKLEAGELAPPRTLCAYVRREYARIQMARFQHQTAEEAIQGVIGDLNKMWEAELVAELNLLAHQCNKKNAEYLTNAKAHLEQLSGKAVDRENLKTELEARFVVFESEANKESVSARDGVFEAAIACCQRLGRMEACAELYLAQAKMWKEDARNDTNWSLNWQKNAESAAASARSAGAVGVQLEAMLVESYAWMRSETRNLEQARVLITEAARIALESRHLWHLSTAFQSFGILASDTGDNYAAHGANMLNVNVREYLSQNRGYCISDDLANAYENLAEALAYLGRLDDACKKAEKAVQLVHVAEEEKNTSKEYPWALLIHARVLVAQAEAPSSEGESKTKACKQALALLAKSAEAMNALPKSAPSFLSQWTIVYGNCLALLGYPNAAAKKMAKVTRDYKNDSGRLNALWSLVDESGAPSDITMPTSNTVDAEEEDDAQLVKIAWILCKEKQGVAVEVMKERVTVEVMKELERQLEKRKAKRARERIVTECADYYYGQLAAAVALNKLRDEAKKNGDGKTGFNYAKEARVYLKAADERFREEYKSLMTRNPSDTTGDAEKRKEEERKDFRRSLFEKNPAVALLRDMLEATGEWRD